MEAGYGGVDIIKDINLEVNEGEIVVIVGPNGAGKSTAMKALLGMLSLTSGSVEYSNEEISSMLPQNRINLGLALGAAYPNMIHGIVSNELHLSGLMNTTEMLFTVHLEIMILLLLLITGTWQARKIKEA